MTKARDIADNAGQGGGASNVIINGAMKISQRSTSVTGITSSGYNTVDRWRTDISSAGTWTQTQNAVTDLAGFRYSLKMACTTANASLGAGSSLRMNTRLEGFDIQQFQKGTASAKKWAMSFYIKASKTGTYIVELFDNNNNRHVNKSYTVDAANTWEHKKIIFDGDTSSPFTNTNGNCLIVGWFLAAGTDFTSGTLQETWGALTHANRCVGQVNLADSTSNTWEITGVQLEVGDKCSDFQHEESSVTQKKCYRYYYKSAAYTLALANASTTGYSYRQERTQNHSFPAGQMRTSPTLTAVDGLVSLSSGGITVTGHIDHVVAYSDTYGGDLPSNNYWYGGYTADAEL